jgi:hypothetical protein
VRWFLPMNRFMNPQAKVAFRVPDGDGTLETESLWAQDLGEDRYRIDNCPLFAYGVSLHDIVLAPRARGIPTFKRVLSKSGNRTIRVVFKESVEIASWSDRILQKLVSLGCGYEGANRIYIAVNVPSRVQLSVVCDYLTEQGLTWEHGDPTFEEVNAGG